MNPAGTEAAADRFAEDVLAALLFCGMAAPDAHAEADRLRQVYLESQGPVNCQRRPVDPHRTTRRRRTH
jgi:hypothetical protein